MNLLALLFPAYAHAILCLRRDRLQRTDPHSPRLAAIVIEIRQLEGERSALVSA